MGAFGGCKCKTGISFLGLESPSRSIWRCRDDRLEEDERRLPAEIGRRRSGSLSMMKSYSSKLKDTLEPLDRIGGVRVNNVGKKMVALLVASLELEVEGGGVVWLKDGKVVWVSGRVEQRCDLR